MHMYSAPELEVVEFLAQDILLTSVEEKPGDDDLGENETPPAPADLLYK